MDLDITKFGVDPMYAYLETLRKVEENDFTQDSPSNPFAMLLEATATNLSIGLEETHLSENTYYKSEAVTMEDLLVHLSNYDEVDLFSTPAKGKFRFSIPINQIIDNGIYNEARSEWVIVIPRYSSVLIDDLRFTLVNDVRITLIQKGNVFYTFVEQVISETSIGLRNIGNTVSAVVVDTDNNNWVIFDMPMLQLYVMSYVAEATPSIPHKVMVENQDYYYRSIVEHQNPADLSWTEVNKSYVDRALDPLTPTVVTSITDDGVRFSIPNNYIKSGELKGTIKYTVFFTRGKIIKRMSNYETDRFTLDIRTSELTEEMANANRLDIIISSTDVIDGGADRQQFKDLRNRVINRTTGELDIPITELQLIEKGRRYGVDLYKVEDSLLRRTFIASRDPVSGDRSIVTPYVYTGVCRFDFNNGDAIQGGIIPTATYMVARSKTVYKYDGSNIIPLTANQLKALSDLPIASGAISVSEDKLLTTPYHMVADNSGDNIITRFYNTDYPKMDMMEIKQKNKEETINVNINGYNVFKDKRKVTYHVFLNLYGNSDYEAYKDDMRVQMVFRTTRNDSVTFTSVLDLDKTREFYPTATKALHYIRVDMKDYITQQDTVVISNGTLDGVTREYALGGKLDMNVYVDNDDVYDAATDVSKDFMPALPNGCIGLTKESINEIFIQPLHRLWTQSFIEPTTNKWRTHDSDILLRYTEDVYQLYDGCEVQVLDTDGDDICDEINRTLLHSKGDPVLDENDEPIYLYREGDVMVDNNGIPIIDGRRGVVRYNSMVYTEYIFDYIPDEEYTAAVTDVVERMTDTLLDTMEDLNKTNIDNTNILFSPTRSFTDIELTDGVIVPSHVSPRITMYIDKDMERTLPTLANMVTIFGGVLSEEINGAYIDLQVIEEKIKALVQGVTLLSIEGLTPDNRRLISIKDPINKLSIRRRIESIRVTSDIDVIVKRV